MILSHDFVWPYSTEFDLIEGSSFNASTGTPHPYLLSPNKFSIRVNATHYETARHDEMCNKTTGSDTDTHHIFILSIYGTIGVLYYKQAQIKKPHGLIDDIFRVSNAESRFERG